MSVHVSFNLFNELEKKDKMRGLTRIVSLLINKFNKFNNTEARMLDYNYHIVGRESKLVSLIFTFFRRDKKMNNFC